MSRRKTHYVVLKVTFDKACTARHAREQVGYCLGSDRKADRATTYYPTSFNDGEPEEFRIRSVQSQKVKP